MGAIRTDFGAILQALEDKLVFDGVVADRTQVVWGVNKEIPQLISTFDIVLQATTGIGAGEGGGGMDGGSYDFRIYKLIDVRVRSQSISDPLASWKTWVTQQFQLENRILNSIGNNQFTPQDDNGNNLTVCPIKVRSDLSPAHEDLTGTYGSFICILDVRFLPNITPIPPSFS
jgi:hypothetical protein